MTDPMTHSAENDAGVGASDICGETYDHRLRLIDERDGCKTWECCGCGAEIVEEVEA